MPQAERGPRGYLPQLDGLRLFCCLFVVVGHSAWGPVLGRLASFGVDVFFALSGFLITRLLLREREVTGTVSLRAFWWRRAVRIMPVYYAALAAAFGATWLLGEAFSRPFRGPDDARFFTSTLAAYAAFAGNLTHAPVPSPVEVLWSVCVEEQFYLLFPLAMVVTRRKHPVLLIAPLGLLAAWGCRLYLAWRGDHELYRHPLAHADGLLLGALGAQAFEAWPLLADRAARRGAALEAAAVGASTVHLVLRWGSVSPLSYGSSFLLSALCGAALVLALTIGEGPLARLLAAPLLARLGALTYAAYVVHMYAVTAAFGLCRRLPLGGAEGLVRSVVSVLITLALAWPVHALLERPLLQARRGSTGRAGGAVLPRLVGRSGLVSPAWLAGGEVQERQQGGLPLAQVIVDVSRVPLVKVTFPDAVTIEDYEELFARYGKLCEKHRRIAWLIDFTRFNPVSAHPKLRQAAATTFEKYRHALAPVSVCESRAVASPLARGVLTAFDWLTGNKWPCRNFATMAEAEAFCHEQLRREGLRATVAPPP